MNKAARAGDKRRVHVKSIGRPPIADEIQQVHPFCHTWQAFCSESRVDLTSHALIVDGKLFFIDPIRLSSGALDELEDLGAEPAAVVLTNGNHERDAKFYWSRYNIPVYAHPEAAREFPFATEAIPSELGALEIWQMPGAGVGEIAVFCREQALLVVGDILINLDSFAFTPLPEKYAADPAQMRTSLLSLNPAEIGTICFAHGLPVTTRAGERLAALQQSLQ